MEANLEDAMETTEDEITTEEIGLTMIEEVVVTIDRDREMESAE